MLLNNQLSSAWNVYVSAFLEKFFINPTTNSVSLQDAESFALLCKGEKSILKDKIRKLQNEKMVHACLGFSVLAFGIASLILGLIYVSIIGAMSFFVFLGFVVLKEKKVKDIYEMIDFVDNKLNLFSPLKNHPVEYKKFV